MKKALLLLMTASLCALPSKAQLSSPENRQITDPLSVSSEMNSKPRTIPVEDFYFTRSAFGPAWSPDGKEIAFVCDMTGRPNLWKIPSEGGWPLQITQSDERQYNAVWSPDGQWIVFQQDAGGNEMWDLYTIPSGGGEAINLTGTPEVREENPLWSPDGSMIAITSKHKDSSSYNISLLDWKTKHLKTLTGRKIKSYNWSAVAWSKDGKYLYANYGDPIYTDQDIYRIDVATGNPENLTSHKGKVIYSATSLSPDGKTILLTSNEKGGYMNVALEELSSKKIRFVTETQWEAVSGSISPDGKSFTYYINEDGRMNAYISGMDNIQPELMKLPEGLNYSAGNPTSYSPDSKSIIIAHQSSTQPPDLWIYEPTDKKTHQLTYSSILSLKATHMPMAKIVHYKSFDGKIISALLWVPDNLKRDSSNAALILPHGGPTGQVVDYWNPDVDALVSKGFICIAPNVRGSTGYGSEFQKANINDLGGGDLKDELYAVKFLKATGYVSSRKIGITGGSYGGFMTLMAVGKAPEVWAAGVELYGIINWFTLYKHSDPALDEYLRGLLGDPKKDSLNYENCSPLKYIHQVKCPLLVLQGDNDPRVPKEEAQQVVDILKKDGKVVGSNFYPDEGHGFVKRENQIDAIKRTIDWFDRYLLGSK